MWSWILAVIGVTGIFFVGRKTIWGWHILLLNEVLWITYAVTTKQYGFIFSAIAYAAVYIKSYLHWSKEVVEDNLRNYLCYSCGKMNKVPQGQKLMCLECAD